MTAGESEPVTCVVIKAIMSHMEWTEEKAVLWMSEKNPLLGNLSPFEMVLRGRKERLLNLVKSLIEEGQGP